MTEERKMWVRMNGIACAVLRETHDRYGRGDDGCPRRRGPERFYKSWLDRQWASLLLLERLTKPVQRRLGWIAA